MTTNDYIFDEHGQDEELVRLRMIEEALDATTIEHLRRTGICAGWRCLELGAGAGSIMKWLGSAVGEGGRVVGVDKNAGHLRRLSEPLHEIVQGDFLEVALDDAFDLAHCRYVLIHNRTAEAMLRKLCNAVKPGGYLVAEEPDFTCAKTVRAKGEDAQQRVNNAVCRMFEQMQLNPGYGSTLPEKIAAEGIQLLDVDSRMHLARGGSPMARMMGASTNALAEKYVATGEASEADLDEYVRKTTDERFWTVYYATVSVIATKRS
jgi:ubiquinone/menaquinone biosynthesis C-methylase UbiE